jgi:hypothetical protein
MSKSTTSTSTQSNPINDIVNHVGMSKSAKIRYLFRAGFTKSQIALMLNIRYQHVRNVLLTPLKGQ